MRYLFEMLIVGIFLSSLGSARQKSNDVVYLKNGGVMRGTIIEMIPEKSVKLQTSDGNILVFSMSEIDRVAKDVPLTEMESQEMRNKIESWYLFFAIGYGSAYYPGQLRQAVDQLNSTSGVSHIGMSIEIPGVYWPLQNNHTIVGGSLNGVADRYEASGHSIQINQYLLSVSSWHFLTGEIGDGIFLRGDLGIAWLNAQSSPGGSSSSSAGFGILVGGGYSYPVSNETRLTLNFNYAARRVEGESYGASSFNIGILL